MRMHIYIYTHTYIYSYVCVYIHTHAYTQYSPFSCGDFGGYLPLNPTSMYVSHSWEQHSRSCTGSTPHQGSPRAPRVTALTSVLKAK